MGRESGPTTASIERARLHASSVTTASELLPGIKDKSGLSKEPIRINKIINITSGEEEYTLFMEKLFAREDILLLLTSGGGFEDRRAEERIRESLNRGYTLQNEREKLTRALVSDPLEDAASRLTTNEQAKNDFLTNRRIAREYKKLYKKQDPERNASRIIADIADIMKNKPDLWKSRNVQSASDRRAINRFAQLDQKIRSMLLTEYFEGSSPAKQEQIIDDHMRAIHNASPLYSTGVESDKAVGYFEGERSDIGEIKEQDGGFILRSQNTRLLVPVLKWSKKPMGRSPNFAENDLDPDPITIEITSRNNPRVRFLYNVNRENYSSVLGLLLVDYFANLRNNSLENVDPGEAIHGAINRASILINSEMIRNAENLLGS